MKKPIQSLLKIMTTALTLALVTGVMSATPVLATPPTPTQSWVATWQASPQPVWGPDFLFPTNVPTELSNKTVRQVVRISLGGEALRIVLSNAYGNQPLLVGRASVARPGEGNKDTVISDSLHAVTFGGQESATILPGTSLVSDPVAFPVPALAEIVVSLYLPDTTPMATFHWDGRQTTWILRGDQTQSTTIGNAALSTTARLLLTGIQVETEQASSAVLVIGDSITDGATASLDTDNRWPDFLAERLVPHDVAVVNAGISGARLLSDGMGMNALARLDRDVLAQPKVQSVIVMLGINDIAWPGTAFAPEADRPTMNDLTSGYRQLIEQIRTRGLRVIGATLTPFEGALPDTPLENYYHTDKDVLRRQVNEWIRNSGAFDAVIDFDAVLRSPENPSRMEARFDSGDHLHPGDEGNRAMAEAVVLDALLPNLNASPATTSSQEH